MEERRQNNKELLRMQEAILRSRGVVRKKIKGKIRHTKLSTTPRDHLKTTHMKLIEIQRGALIEELLLSDSVTNVAKKLKLDKGTVSKWIQRLCLNMDTDSLPDCSTCNQARVECLQGLCWKVETYDPGLVEVKKQKMIEEGVIDGTD